METNVEVSFVPEMKKWLIAKPFAEDKMPLVEGHEAFVRETDK